MYEAADDQAGETLNRFAEAMFRLMVERYQSHLNEMDLTMVQAQVLRLLHRGSLSTGELAAGLGISAPAVTQLTDRLLRKRLIERRSAPGDRRSVMVILTIKGKRAVERFREKRGDILRVALDSLPAAERAQAIASLGKMVAAMDPEGRAALGGERASNQNGERRPG